MTARDLAGILGIYPQSVYNWEAGKTSVDDGRAEQLAKALGMDLIEVRRGLRLWVPPHESPDVRLRRLADARVAAIGVTWDWVAEHTELDRSTVEAFRMGGIIGPAEVAAIEKAILWAADSRHEVLAGGDPIEIPPTADVEDHYVAPHSRDLVRVVVQDPDGGEISYALPRDRWKRMSDEEIARLGREMVAMVRSVQEQTNQAENNNTE